MAGESAIIDKKDSHLIIQNYGRTESHRRNRFRLFTK